MLIIRKVLYIIAFLVVVIIISFIIPKETTPPDDTRIILEHTYEKYIAPTCFEQANASNFLEEATLKQAHELNYDANDTCTEQFFQSEKDYLFISIMKSIGIISSKWNE